MSAFGPKQTCAIALHMSAFGVKRTLSDRGPQRLLSHEVGITTCIATGPNGHASSCDHPNQGHPNQGHPNQDPSQGPGRGDNAIVPSGHASSVFARPSSYRGWRWQSQEAGGSVPRGQFRSHPQIPDPRFRPQIVCVTFVSTRFFPWLKLSRSLERAANQLKNGPAVP